MKIEKTSWHYRMINDFDSSYFWGMESVALCPYVRKLILACSEFAINVMTCLAFISIMMYTIMWGLFDVYHSPYLAFIALILWPVAGVFALSYVQSYPESKYNPILFTYTKKQYKQKETSLFRMYIKSLHDKVCPIMKIE